MTTPIVRAMTKGAYDLQALRMQTGLRLCANFRAKLGATTEDVTLADEDLSEEAKKLIKQIKEAYARVTRGVIEQTTTEEGGRRRRHLPRRDEFVADEIISTYSELILIDQYLALEAQERRQFADLEPELMTVPIYRDFLSSIRGIGPAMGAVIVTTLNPHEARHVSAFWKYAGVDVGPDGRGRSRRKEHLIEREYTNKDGETDTRLSLTYNPWLKTKLMGVLSGSFLRSGSPYREHYDRYRHRLESDPHWQERSKLHRHNAAMRYMIKMFLRDLWVRWREIEGLPVTPTYHEAKLGHVHGRDAA